ncbi:MAG: hemerythrin domain-containing protein, partial [Clostridia bacterium]|nr:hemerythrin domain-containing protein [Clostridia bacterium]
MSPNEQAVARIVAHHRAMVGELDRRVGELVRAVEAGVPHAPALAAVSEYLVSDVFPHARAEEATLYAAARGQELRSLVAAMVDEHRWLLDAARELREAGSGVAAAAAARARAAALALLAPKG